MSQAPSDDKSWATDVPSVASAYDQFAAFHDAHYTDRRAEIDFYTSLVGRPAGSVLEHGCGTGALLVGSAQRMASPHEETARLVGLDLSVAMLRQARARASHLGWIRADMTQSPVSGTFDLVFCAFNTLQMLETKSGLVQTLARAGEQLRCDGCIAFDVYNAACIDGDRIPVVDRRNRIVGTFMDASGGPCEIREEAWDDPTGESVVLEWRVRELSATAPTERARLIVRLRHYTPEVIDEAVGAAGLHIVARYGDVRRARFEALRSRKQVVVCSR
jgi:SAM-dependent methyltransferase